MRNESRFLADTRYIDCYGFGYFGDEKLEGADPHLKDLLYETIYDSPKKFPKKNKKTLRKCLTNYQIPVIL
jgi:hypothetical protein